MKGTQAEGTVQAKPGGTGWLRNQGQLVLPEHLGGGRKQEKKLISQAKEAVYASRAQTLSLGRQG